MNPVRRCLAALRAEMATIAFDAEVMAHFTFETTGTMGFGTFLVKPGLFYGMGTRSQKKYCVSFMKPNLMNGTENRQSSGKKRSIKIPKMLKPGIIITMPSAMKIMFRQSAPKKSR